MGSANGSIFSLDPLTPRLLEPLVKLTNPRGMALILCLLVISTLSLVGTFAYRLCTLNQKIVYNHATQVKAFYAAEAGREQATAFLRNNLLWRGGNAGQTGFHEENFGEEHGLGKFSVWIADCTDDENGIFDALIPGGYVRLSALGTYAGSRQTSTCLVRFFPDPEFPANVPFKAVVSSGENDRGLFSQGD